MTTPIRHSLTPDQHADFAWLRDGPHCKIIAALLAARADCARYVGGCVRDSLSSLGAKDIDIATQLSPQAVMVALEAAGLRYVPTGLEHGTVTAINGQMSVEITTLRADVETDGRRAVVAFTEDWQEDALRRDFTINALYLSVDGVIFDYTGGLSDLEQRRVVFIGDAEQRLREDYLRVLRFFRFSARFADSFDPTALQAVTTLREGLHSLSAERIGAEMTAILGLREAPRAIRAMIDSRVLEELIAEAPRIEALAALKQELPPQSDPMLALAALFPETVKTRRVAKQWRLSNGQMAHAQQALQAKEALAGVTTLLQAKQALYRLGRDAFHDGAVLLRAIGQDFAFADLTQQWPVPIFPVKGRDVLAAGVPAGPQVTAILAATEEEWMAQGFPDEEMVRTILRSKIIVAKKP